MKTLVILTIAAAAIMIPGVVKAQESYKRDIPDSLQKLAKVSEESAAKTAQKRVPKGPIQSVELEREKGKLIYSYDMKVAGRSGVEEVNVDAMTGKVVRAFHVSEAAEKKESATEKKEPKPPTKKP